MKTFLLVAGIFAQAAVLLGADAVFSADGDEIFALRSNDSAALGASVTLTPVQ
jgi:hypothetical protein